jgi:hypothetical protein
MSSAGFKPAIPGIRLLQIFALDRTVFGIGMTDSNQLQLKDA